MTRGPALRILDVNFNRAREGLRVCEELCRFALDNARLRTRLRGVRHALGALVKSDRFNATVLAAARDSRRDVGRQYDAMESGRAGLADVFAANIERVKESLRVLEEVSKTVDAEAPATFKALRFEVYDIEKKALRRLASVRDHDRPLGNATHRERASGRGRRR